MSEIPAASLRGINLERVRNADPTIAAEIDRIGKLIDAGAESDHEFVWVLKTLCELGEANAVEELIVANACDDDQLLQLHQQYFPHAEGEYSSSVAKLAEQLGAELTRSEWHFSLFDWTYLCKRQRTPRDPHSLDWAWEVVGEPCHARVTYVRRDTIEAELFDLPVEMVSNKAIFLTYNECRWVQRSDDR